MENNEKILKINKLEIKIKSLYKKSHKINNEILQTLHEVFDNKIKTITLEELKEEVNYYCGDTFAKLMYINFLHNEYEDNIRTKS